jgi:hypothetical protein
MTRMLGGQRGLAVAVALFLAALGVFLILILAEDDPPAEAEDLPPGCARGLPHLTCTFTSSTKLSVDQLADQIYRATNKQVDDSTPIWIQAWGGRGGKGASDQGYAGAFGGYGGYAITVSSREKLDGKELYLYVGASGSRHANYSGQGGAATIVATQPITQDDSVPGNLLVVAGGGGGGGKNCSGDGAARGGVGGVAVAGHVKHDATSGYNDYEAGQPGAGGSGGDGGARGGQSGGDGLGGYGGAGDSKGSPAGWVNVSAVDPAAEDWNAGAGGEGRGGGGGGGYGGGGGGGGCEGNQSDKENGGGAGGGSWTLEGHGANLDDPAAPTDTKQADGAESKVVLTFNLS